MVAGSKRVAFVNVDISQGTQLVKMQVYVYNYIYICYEYSVVYHRSLINQSVREHS